MANPLCSYQGTYRTKSGRLTPVSGVFRILEGESGALEAVMRNLKSGGKRPVINDLRVSLFLHPSEVKRAS
jgi:hypothetical protein